MFAGLLLSADPRLMGVNVVKGVFDGLLGGWLSLCLMFRSDGHSASAVVG
jgi:hypothetical protein